MWEALSEYRVCCGWRTVITNELQARYHSRSSIGGPFKLPGIVQKQQTTTSVHKNHHVSNLCCYNLCFSINWRTKLPCVCGKPCTNNVLDAIITAGIDGYQIMCNLCRYGPSPDWSQLHPGPARSGPGHEICILFYITFYTLFVCIKWLKQSQVTCNYCLSIGNILKACASQNYTVMFIYLMHDTQACPLNKNPL